jgi:hypothetical protein
LAGEALAGAVSAGAVSAGEALAGAVSAVAAAAVAAVVWAGAAGGKYHWQVQPDNRLNPYQVCYTERTGRI